MRRSARISAGTATALGPQAPGSNAVTARQLKSTATTATGRGSQRGEKLAVTAAATNQTAKGRKRKSLATAANTVYDVPDLNPPATPKRKRSSTHANYNNDTNVNNNNPTISDSATAAPLNHHSIHNPTITSATTPRQRDNRPADPHRTNATLLTPHGSHVTAYPSATHIPESPSKKSSSSLASQHRPTARTTSATTTTANLLDEAVAHLLRVDSRLAPLIKANPCPLFSAAGLAEKIDPFNALASGIIGQQVSGAAALSIKNKFVSLFNKDSSNGGSGGRNVNHDGITTTAATATAAAGKSGTDEAKSTADERYTGATSFPTPDQVANTDIATLRTAGLSQRKAEYIQGLAEKFTSGELSARMLVTASDEEVLEKLIAVRGLGRWSVEMFSCFGLKRMDVFSTGDLGVQ